MEVQRRWLWNGKWIWLIMKGEKGEFPESSGSFLKTDKVRYQRTVLNCSLVTMQTPMNCHKPQSVTLILDPVCMCKMLSPAWGTPWEPRACLATLSIPSAWCGIVLRQSKCLTTFLEERNKQMKVESSACRMGAESGNLVCSEVLSTLLGMLASHITSPAKHLCPPQINGLVDHGKV